jgi:hypothetical protein
MMLYPRCQAGILAESPVNFSASRPAQRAGLLAVQGNPSDGPGRDKRPRHELPIRIKTITYWHIRELSGLFAE